MQAVFTSILGVVAGALLVGGAVLLALRYPASRKSMRKGLGWNDTNHASGTNPDVGGGHSP